MIQTEGLTRVFGAESRRLIAVDSLTLSVAPGEVFGCLGPNGAGKTTTVRMLTGLINPSSGRATVAGLEVGRDNQAIRQIVGLLTETPGMYDRLSAEKNLAIFARLYGVPDVAGSVEKYLRLLGLWERRHDTAGSFSKGMRQKLALARALIHEPRLLFLDEPTSGLDPEAAKLVRDFIAELKAEGRTIFLCTHNLAEAERLCDRIGILNTRMVTVDTPANLHRQLFGRRVVVHLRRPQPRLADVARELAFVQSAEWHDSRLVVALDDPESDNPTLVRRLVEAGAEVQFVGELRQSLEDVYLRLIDSDA
jgi:ABC-2 type transport system ATP-binding protein